MSKYKYVLTVQMLLHDQLLLLGSTEADNFLCCGLQRWEMVQQYVTASMRDLFIQMLLLIHGAIA